MNHEHAREDGPGRPEEAALSAVLREAADDLTPNTPALVRGGMARGRRMRTVRRAQVVVAAVAVVALGGAGTVALSDLNGGAGVSGPASAGSVSTGTDAKVPSPSAVPPQKANPLTAQALLDALRPLLPQGGAPIVVDPLPQQTNGESELGVYVTVNPDGKGPSRVSLLISTNKDPLICFDTTGVNSTCDLVPLPDGSQLRLEKNWETPASATTADDKGGPNGAGPKLWSAWLQRPDGVLIYLSASSSGTERGADTRTDPALDSNQLSAIVSADAWKTLITPGSLPVGTKPAATR